jgi:hypothetical protein
VSGEESVLSIEGYRPDGPLDSIVVDLDAAVGQEELQAIPVFGDVGQSFADWGLDRDTSTVMNKPSLHIGDQRGRPFLSRRKASLWIEATQFCLDPIQFTDPFDAVLGNG